MNFSEAFEFWLAKMAVEGAFIIGFFVVLFFVWIIATGTMTIIDAIRRK